MYIETLLSPRRVSLGVAATSKTHLFEHIGFLLGEGAGALDTQRALGALLDRERLGSTGIGSGVALPHGRVQGLAGAVGAFCTLAEALDYDSIDCKPVTMAFALLVPAEASDEHLRILAELAGLFSSKNWREQLLAAQTPEDLYNRLTHPLSAQTSHESSAYRARSL